MATKTQHTPGPWKRMFTFNVINAGGRLVASCAGHQSTVNAMAVEAENEANARLIAAAPELLAALKRIVGELEAALPAINAMCVMEAVHGREYSGPTIDINAAKVAIAKAEATDHA